VATAHDMAPWLSYLEVSMSQTILRGHFEGDSSGKALLNERSAVHPSLRPCST
jgi:hypothetical protein